MPYRIGWIICTNSEGDSLWYREYTLVQGEYSWNFLYDIIQANDSGFIASGYINPVSPDPGPQSTWVIKVDSIGCESPEYCWVGEEEAEEAPAGQGRLTAFPNPAQDRVTFRVTGEELHAGAIITVYNIYGIRAFDQILSEASAQWRVDVSHWPPGLYVARIVFSEKPVGNVKLIVYR